MASERDPHQVTGVERFSGPPERRVTRLQAPRFYMPNLQHLNTWGDDMSSVSTSSYFCWCCVCVGQSAQRWYHRPLLCKRNVSAAISTVPKFLKIDVSSLSCVGPRVCCGEGRGLCAGKRTERFGRTARYPVHVLSTVRCEAQPNVYPSRRALSYP